MSKVVRGGRHRPLTVLQIRQKNHVMTSKETAVKGRWSSGGFKRPGSNNRHKQA